MMPRYIFFYASVSHWRSLCKGVELLGLIFWAKNRNTFVFVPVYFSCF